MSSVARKIKTASRVLKFKNEYKKAGAGTKIDPNAVFFISDVSDELSGNLRCVYDGMGGSYKKQVYCKSKHLHPQTDEDIRAIAEGLATCGHVFLEDVLDFTEFIDPAPEQEIIQLWHACGAYKKFGFARPQGGAPVRVSKGHRKYTGAIVSSEEIRGCYAEAFDIPVEKIQATGIPRTDMFFQDACREEAAGRVLEKYPQITGRKKILFAPTYRGTRIADASYDFDMLDPEAFLAELGDEYTLMFKWHPAMAGNISKGADYPYRKYLDGVSCIDVSGEDIQDLMLVCDLMITDYSSVIFEYLLTDKPIIYYVYDCGKYAHDRGMFYPFEEYVYGETAQNQKELVEAVRRGDLMDARRQKFRQKFMAACDGHATQRVCELYLKEQSR